MSREEQEKHERTGRAGRGKEGLVLLVAGLVFLGSDLVPMITILLLLLVAALLAWGAALMLEVSGPKPLLGLLFGQYKQIENEVERMLPQ